MQLNSRLLAGSAIAMALGALTTPAAARQAADAPAPRTTQDEAATEIDELVITGSRIKRSGADSPTPVTIVDAEAIRMSGVSELADLVNQIPSLFVTQNNQTSNQLGNAGLNALDLRGLGTERTLVLVNGRRRVPAMPGSSAVDISAIPTGLVQRVDVITGGASALYGADAVAGVANFILKEDFEGLEFNGTYSNSSRDDMPGYDADILFGRNFQDGRGNITAFGSYSKHTGLVLGQDRPWTAKGTPNYLRQPDGAYKLTDNTRSLYDHYEAVVELGARNFYTFNADGSMRPLQLGPGGIINPTATQFTSYLTDGGELLGRYDDWALVVPTERYTISVSGNYDLTPTLEVFGDFTYSHTESRGEYRARQSYGTDFVPSYSPFITAEMIAANGGGGAFDAYFARRYTELGRSQTLYDRGMFQATIGLEGDLPSILGKTWEWSAYYAYGETRQEVSTRNATADNRYYMALDTYDTGGGVAGCVSTFFDPTNGCVPLNPFKPLTADVIDYLQYDTSPAVQTLRQHVFSAYATGDLFSVPAGMVQGVIGAEYRKEGNSIGVSPELDPTSSKFDPSIGITSTALDGEYEVAEIFGELRVPILSNLPMAEDLSFEGAIRYSDYSTAGTTDAYKLALNWSPVSDIRFRTSYGQAVRAPNISELYTSSSIASDWLADPCNYWDVVNRASRTQYTAANCAVISPANVNTYWQWLPVNWQGNADLDVETAKTFTAGVVLRPRFIPNLSLTVDYFDITLEKAIDAFGAQTILNKCVDAPTLNNMFCNFVHRDPVTDNLITVDVKQLNLSQYVTRGLDFELNYRFALSDIGLGDKAGSVAINAVYTKLLERSFVLDPTDPSTSSDTVGLFGSPEWKGAIRTTYTNGPWSVNWTVRHFSPMRPGASVTKELYDVYETDHVFYNDVYASYDVNARASVFGGLRNAFDEAPPRVPGAEAGGANFEYGYQAGTFDVIGRTFFIGVRLRR